MIQFELVKPRGDEDVPFLNGINSILIHDELYSFGGSPQIFTYINDTFKFSILDEKFQKLNTKGEIPKQRILHTAIAYQNELYIWGGTPFDKHSNQFFKFNPNSNTWSIVQTENPIAPRFGHTMNLLKDSFILFGGFCKEIEYSNTIQRFCLKKKIWSEIKFKNEPPERRYMHSSLIYTNNLFIYSGMSESKPLNDLWKFNFDTLLWKQILTSDYFMNCNNLQFIFQDSLYFISGTKLIVYQFGLEEFKEYYVDKLPQIYNSSCVFHKGSLYIYGGLDGIGKINFGFKEIDSSYYGALKKNELTDIIFQIQI